MKNELRKYDNHIEVVSGDIVGQEKKKNPLILWVAIVVLLITVLSAMLLFAKGLGVRDVVPEKPQTLKNVWIEGGDATTLRFYADGEHESMPLGRDVTKHFNSGDDSMVPEGIADVDILNGEVTGIAIKGEAVPLKLLSLSERGIELEGFGFCEISDGFRVYSTLDGLSMAEAKDIPVGYQTAEYIIEDGVCQAAIVTKSCDYKNIRVALGNTGYTSLIHQSVILSSDSPLKMTYAGNTKTFEADEKIEITPESGYLTSGRIRIEPTDANGKIRVESIERGGSIPDYRGAIEVSTYEGDGILVINELPMETYLYSVVPSEMPVSFGPEALKAQAICARAYAYRKMREGSYAKYGAHLDDSTMTQVYRAVAEAPESIEAVDATKGIVPVYNGEVIEAYFFSTSCGTTSNNADARDETELPYLKDILESETAKPANFEKEEDFRNLIDHPEEYDLIESEYPMFRWTITYTDDEMQQAVKDTIEKRYQANPSQFTWKGKPKQNEEKTNLSEADIPELPDLGRIKEIEVSKRGKSGIVKELTIRGKKATIVVSGQTNIRALMTPINVKLKNAEGSVSEGWSSLPSPFYYIERDEEDAYIIRGGGFGHGVGLSQNGTKTLAEQEMSAEDIIKHYYTGVELKKIDRLEK